MKQVVSFLKKPDQPLSQGWVLFSASLVLLLWSAWVYQEPETLANPPPQKPNRTKTVSSSDPSAEQQAPLVQVIQPHPREFSSAISLPANVSPWEQLTMYGKVSGYIKSMNFRVGDTVKRGEVMAVIDAPEFQENFEKAQEEYKIKALTYQRLKAVWTENPDAIAKEELDAAEALAKAAQKLMENKRDLLEYTKIRAPFSGTVTGRFADPGILIQSATEGSSPAIPLYTFMDISTVRVFVNVPQEVPQRVTPGFSVTLTSQDLKDWTLNSIVTRTTRALDSETKTLLVEIDLPNTTGKLIPDMLITATFHFKSNPNALVIPNKAIHHNFQKGSTSVFIAKDGNVKRLAIKSGLEGGNWTEVLEGLTGQENVIVTEDNITEGQKIRTEPYSLPSG